MLLSTQAIASARRAALPKAETEAADVVLSVVRRQQQVLLALDNATKFGYDPDAFSKCLADAQAVHDDVGGLADHLGRAQDKRRQLEAHVQREKLGNLLASGINKKRTAFAMTGEFDKVDGDFLSRGGGGGV